MSNIPYKYQEFTETGVTARIAEASERETGLTPSMIKNQFGRTLAEVKAMLERLIDRKMVTIGYAANRKTYWTTKDQNAPLKILVKNIPRDCFTPEMSTAYGLRLREILEAAR